MVETRTKKETAFISIDVETSGSIPGIHSMLAIGACDIDNQSKTFYAEIKPVSKQFEQEALNVCGFTLEQLQITGEKPLMTMRRFALWIEEVAINRKPLGGGNNMGFDWSFLNYYFHRFLQRNPLGHTSLDFKSYGMGKFDCDFGNAAMKAWPEPFTLSPLSHNALGDALNQGESFRKLRDATWEEVEKAKEIVKQRNLLKGFD